MLGHKRIPSREGGIEVVVEELATRMAEKGHQVTCYNRKGHHVAGAEFDTEQLKEYKGVKCVDVFTINKRGLAAMTASFFGAVKAAFSSYDVVHFHAEGPAFMCWFPKLFGKKIYTTVHGLDHKRAKWGRFASWYIKTGEKNAVRFSDEIIVLSKGVQDYFMQTYGRKTVFIPNGVNRPEIYAPKQIKENYGLEKDDYILYLGRLVPEKGEHYLIEAFKNCKTDKKLVIAGGSESNRDYYNQLLELADGDKRIVFTGYVYGQEVQELYSNSYIFALPSNLEGMANALLEAMSYGNCCLISDIPENTEVVHEKAMWFEKENAMDLQKKLQMLLNDSELVKKYKTEAAPYILERYSWDIVVDQMLRVYAGDVVDYDTVLRERECSSGEKA